METIDELKNRIESLENELMERNRSEKRLLKANDGLQDTNSQLETAIERAHRIAFEAEVAFLEIHHIFNTSADGMCVIDKNFQIIRMNHTFSQLLGIDKYSATGKKCYEILLEDECHTPDCPLTKILGGKERLEYDVIRELHDKTKISCILTATALRGPNREILGIVKNYKDITYRKKMEDRLRELARTDDLTKLFNRRHFMDLSNLEFARAKRYRHTLSMIMIDADHFKSINDRYGHDVGDRALRVIAEVSQANLRDIDILGRIGGEEFAALLPETDLNGAVKAAERLRCSVDETTMTTTRGPLSFSVSIGVATTDETVNDLETLLRMTDKALYLAKAKGRNRVETFRP